MFGAGLSLAYKIRCVIYDGMRTNQPTTCVVTDMRRDRVGGTEVVCAWWRERNLMMTLLTGSERCLFSNWTSRDEPGLYAGLSLSHHQ